MNTKSIKSGILFILFFFMMVLKMPYSYANEDEFDFKDNPDGSVTITAYKGNGGAVVIPNQLNGKVVTGIDTWVFDNKKLSNVTIPETITTIGAYAFYQNHLTNVTLPSSISSISDGAFALNQLTNVTLPNNLKSIGAYAFSGNALESIDIPNSVINIGHRAFSSNNILNLIIPDGLETIGESAFAGNDIESIEIPVSVKSIGSEAFSNNYLKNIQIKSKDVEIGNDAFVGHHPDLLISAPNPSTTKEYADVSNIKFQVLKYVVSFETNGGTKIESQMIELEKTLHQPNNSVKPGYVFEGWFKDITFTESWEFDNDIVTADITLYAKWTSKSDVEVLFESNGGSIVAPKHIKYNDLLIEPSNPTKADFIFEGWYKDVELTAKWDFTTERVQDTITVYAKWVKNENLFSFVTNGGTKVSSQLILYNDKAVEPQNPIKIGYVFKGWYKDHAFTALWDFDTDVVTRDTTLYAKWEVQSQYTLDFDTNGGSTVPSQRMAGNSTATKPTNPTKIGHTFAGWYKDTNFTTPWNFNIDVVTSNTTLYAKWLVNGSSSEGGSINPTPTPEQLQPEKPQPVPIKPMPTPEQPQPEKPQPAPIEPIPQTEEITFSDVQQDHWAWKMIQQMAKQGIITGYQDGTFKPNAPIQRQHVALMLTRALELKKKKEVDAFNDIPTTHLYFEVISQVQQAGLFDGIDGKFQPKANMTRAQMAKVLVLALDMTSTEKKIFKDVPITHWAYDYIAILAANGIATGYQGNFRANDFVTRAEFTTFLYRVLYQ